MRGFVFRLSSQTFTLLGGEPATKDLMDGVDTTWNRFPDYANVGKLADKTIADFNTNNLAANVPGLLAIRAELNRTNQIKHLELTRNPVVDDKRAQLDHIIQECLGLTVETIVPSAEVVPGQSVDFPSGSVRPQRSARSSGSNRGAVIGTQESAVGDGLQSHSRGRTSSRAIPPAPALPLLAFPLICR